MSEAAASSPAQGAPARASLADWLAVAAGTLGALMAMVDVSIVNASLPIIQGEIGATSSEGTWIGTAYLVSEVVVIPLTAWLERLMSLRRLLLVSASLFTLFSVVCGLSTSLEVMIFGRVGQGLAGGVLIPTGLSIVARRLPPAQQPIGLAFVAMSALLGPVAGPLLGGWLTEHYSWHLAFFMNVPLCLCQAILIAVAIPKSAGDWHELRNADWLGVVGMAVGLGAATTFLEEGHREQWFESTIIWQLAAASLVGFGLIAVGQLRATRPVIRLSMLRNRNLASALSLMMALGVLLYSNLFIIPQFLVAVAGYNAFQAGQVAFLSGTIAIPAAFLFPMLAARIDMRWIVAGAISAIAFAAFIAGKLTVQSSGSDFLYTQLLYGVGTTLSALPLQQMAMTAVSSDDSPEAASLMSIARNLGGSIGLAAIAGFQEQRFELHHWQINGALGANDIEVQHQMADAAAQFGGGPEGMEAAYRALDGQVMQQASVMTFNDMFVGLALIGALVVPLVLFLRPARLRDRSAVVH